MSIGMSFTSVLADTEPLKEIDVTDDVETVDRIVSDYEYFTAVVEYEGISYNDAKTKVTQARKLLRGSPESIVTIHRTVTKSTTPDFTLKCSAYLEVVRDNITGNYIEIPEVIAPYVDLSGPTIDTTSSST